MQHRDVACSESHTPHTVSFFTGCNNPPFQRRVYAAWLYQTVSGAWQGTESLGKLLPVQHSFVGWPRVWQQVVNCMLEIDLRLEVARCLLHLCVQHTAQPYTQHGMSRHACCHTALVVSMATAPCPTSPYAHHLELQNKPRACSKQSNCHVQGAIV